MLFALVLCCSLSPQVSDAQSANIAREYVELNFRARKLEQAAAKLAEDAFFIDPTGEVFGGPLSKGLRGRAQILKLQQSLGVVDTSFDTAGEFSAGEYAVFAGHLSFGYQAGGRFEDVPFITILRVADGFVQERHDYGDYSPLVPQAPASDAVLKQGRDYVKTYVARDFEALAKLQTEDCTFQDPTAVMLGAGREQRGPEAIRANFERAFTGCQKFEYEPTFEFAFGRYAVFAGTCRYAFPGRALGVQVESAEFELPLIVVLETKDGRVASHKDYADYAAFREQLARQAAGGAPGAGSKGD